MKNQLNCFHFETFIDRFRSHHKKLKHLSNEKLLEKKRTLTSNDFLKLSDTNVSQLFQKLYFKSIFFDIRLFLLTIVCSILNVFSESVVYMTRFYYFTSSACKNIRTVSFFVCSFANPKATIAKENIFVSYWPTKHHD